MQKLQPKNLQKSNIFTQERRESNSRCPGLRRCWYWSPLFCQMLPCKNSISYSTNHGNQTVSACDKVGSAILFTRCCRHDPWTLRHWIQIDPQSSQSSAGSGSLKMPAKYIQGCFSSFNLCYLCQSFSASTLPVAASVLSGRDSPCHRQRTAEGVRSRSGQEESTKPKHFQTAKTFFIQNHILMIMTRSIVFFLLASERVWSTKVSQRPLQSSGSSTPTTKKTAALRRRRARSSSSRTRKCWNYMTLSIMVEILTH